MQGVDWRQWPRASAAAHSPRQAWTFQAASLERAGLLPGRVVGKTCVSDGGRGTEVDSWLKLAPYPVESFVILDDKDDMEMHRQRLVQVDPAIGLSVKEVRRALELLSIPWQNASA